MLRWPTFWKFNFKVCKFDITLNAFLVVFISAFTYVIYICLDICWYKYNLITYFMFALFLCLNSILILPCTHVLSLTIDVVLIFYVGVYHELLQGYQDISRDKERYTTDTPWYHDQTCAHILFFLTTLWYISTEHCFVTTMTIKFTRPSFTRPFVNYQEWLQFTWYRAYICTYISWLKLHQ